MRWVPSARRSLTRKPFRPQSLRLSTLRPNLMRSRRVSQAALAAAVAGSAWYMYGPSNRLDARPVSSSGAATTTAAAGLPSDKERKALIVENGALYTTQLPPGQPITKNDVYGRQVLEMLDDEACSAKLRKSEESYFVKRGRGVVRYDTVGVPSNNPIEDDHVEKIISVPASIAAPGPGEASSDWMFWGMFDGHVGWATSALLRQTLVSYVAKELNATYKAALDNPALQYPAASSVDQAIKKAFTTLDDELVHGRLEKVMSTKSRALATEVLAPAVAGACALLSFYDSRSQELRVAVAGDSRAVLGRRGPNGKWTATALSQDQTGGTKSEIARLKAEHPGEPDVCSRGRILGQLEPSRSFGDASYKWSRALQEKLTGDYFLRRIPPLLKTPPYVTAEPVITTTKIDPARQDFLVMATDGLWEMLTNDEVVGLVGMWLDRQDRNKAAVGPTAGPSRGSWLPGWLGGKQDALPLEATSDKVSKSGQRAPIRRRQWGTVEAEQSDRFVVQDNNVATHLVRNGLGGKDKNMLSALLTLTSPNSRSYRDDVTVQVIFFGHGPDTGDVEVNKDASTGVSVEGLKPKL